MGIDPEARRRYHERLRAEAIAEALSKGGSTAREKIRSASHNLSGLRLLEVSGSLQDNPRGEHVSAVANLFADIDRACNASRNFAVAQLSAATGRRAPEPIPWLLTAQMASPWYLALLTGPPTATVLWWLLRHPDEIGSWLPKIRVAWNDGMADLEVAKRRRAAIHNAAVARAELELRSAALELQLGALQRFEVRLGEDA